MATLVGTKAADEIKAGKGRLKGIYIYVYMSIVVLECSVPNLADNGQRRKPQDEYLDEYQPRPPKRLLLLSCYPVPGCTISLLALSMLMLMLMFPWGSPFPYIQPVMQKDLEESKKKEINHRVLVHDRFVQVHLFLFVVF